MPAKSRKQQRYLHHRFGHAWVKRHHFDKLKRRKRKTKR
jgi:hypothetical protein